MAKFDAGTAVEQLEWDFTAYKGGKGVIPEPSTLRMNTFFNSMRSLVSEVRGLRDVANQVGDDVDLTGEEALNVLEQVDEATAKAQGLQAKTVENLAYLCGAEWVETGETNEDGTSKQVLEGGSPSLDQLEKLPFRVLQAFSQWLVGEIRPKTSQSQPATNTSRKGRRRTGS